MRRASFTSGRLLALLLFAVGVAASVVAAPAREVGRPIFQTYPPGLHLRHLASQTLVQDEAGWIVFANGPDLLAFDGKNWVFFRLPTESGGVRQFARAEDGTLYAVGPGVLGHLRGSGQRMTFVSLLDRLPAGACDVESLRSVAAAGDTVAFADATSVFVWRAGAFSVLSGVASPGTRGLRLHAVGGQILVTAPGQPLHRLEGAQLVPVADGASLRENQVVAIVPGREAGELLLLTAENGFLVVGGDGSVAAHTTALDPWLKDERVFRARRLADGSWAVVFAASSGWRGLLFSPDGALALRIGKANGVYAEFVRDLVPDREGGLWAVLDTGAARFEWPAPVSLFDGVNGLGRGAVESLARHDGTLFAATAEGVFRLRPSAGEGESARFERVTAPVAEEVRAQLNASRLPADRAARATEGWPHFVREALGPVTCVWEERTETGRVLWLGGRRGLIRWEPETRFAVPPPLVLRIESVGVEAGGELPTDHAPLTLQLSAIRQQRANRVVYRTRLIGREAAWSEWSERNQISYPHLAPRSYVFEAQARDADGVESAVRSLRFAVLPPWWMSPWALAGWAALAGGTVYAIVRWRTRELSRRAAELEGIVAARTSELAEKNRELARLHRLEFDEKVAARLGEEKARLEVLRYQLNPHFLFNALASISGSLPPDAVARGMVERLAEFCRLTLHRADEEGWTTLGDEMRLLRAYFAIEQARWADLLAVEVEHDSALDAEPLPYFLLLPLVENALKYGHATSPDRVGIRLGTRRDGNGDLIVEVANTGEWVEPAAVKSVASLGIGLENLRQRLRRFYPEAHALEFQAKNGWVTARLRLGRARRESGAI